MNTVGIIRSTVGGIMMHVGATLSTVGVFSTMGGYHEYHGGVQYHGGTQITKKFSPAVLNTPMALMISCHMHHDILPGTEHPPLYT